MSPIATAPDPTRTAAGLVLATALGLDPAKTAELQLHVFPTGSGVFTWLAPWVNPAGVTQWVRERRDVRAPQLEAFRAAQYLREFAARYAHGHPGDSAQGIEATCLESTASILEGLART